MVKGAASPEALAKSLDAWKAKLSGDPRIVTAIMQPGVMADLAGQMFVQNVEVGSKTRLLANEVRPAFLDLPFQEALDFWVRRGGSEEMLKKVLGHYRRQAGYASDLLLDATSRDVLLRIDATLANGGTMDDFVTAIQSDQVGLGLTPMDSSYLQTVFITNVQTAYGAGRFRQLTDPEVIAVRPYVQYRTADDNRVRPNHAILNNTIYDAGSDVWYRVAPPGGFRCRCSFVSLDESDLKQERSNGYQLLTALPPGSDPDTGFDGPPTDLIDA